MSKKIEILTPIIMKLIHEGHSYSEIAEDLGLKNEKVIRNLVYRINHPKENSLPKKRGRKPKENLRDYKHYYFIIRGVKASVKYKVIYRHKDSYSISEMCRFFEVSRSGYYDFVNRLDTPAKDLPLDQMIQQCQEQCRNTYGYRRVHIWLERQGVHKNPKTVLRIMRKYNLLAVIRCRKYKHYRDTLHRYPNLLNRNFHADRPNQKWVTDISYIKTLQGTLYLSIIRDLYDNSIVAYQTGTGQNNQLVLNTIRKAKRKEGVTAELQLHSDQGFQYTSHGYFKLTQAYGITPSMSRKGNPYDNAPAENFFSILKTECIYRTKLSSFEEARSIIDEYIYFYNYQRIQTRTKLTPMELRCQFLRL